MAVVPSLVDDDHLGAANALTQGAEQVSGVLGPALAASMLALFGLGAGFGATALLFLISTALFGALARVVKPAETAAGEAPREGVGQTTALADLVEGIRYVLRDPVFRSLLLILLCINLAMVGPLYVGGAVLAESRLGGAGAFGVLVAAAGAGSLVGVVGAGSIPAFRRRGPIALGSTGLLGIIVAAIAFVPNLATAVVLAAAIGVVGSFLGIINVTWLQERSEPGLTGRVMSLAMFAAVALDPISFALAGVLVELDLAATFVGAGILLLLTALLGAASRTMRAAD
jgi:hypothetical protein